MRFGYGAPNGSSARAASGQTTIRVSRRTVELLEKLRAHELRASDSIHRRYSRVSFDEFLYALAAERLNLESEK